MQGGASKVAPMKKTEMVEFRMHHLIIYVKTVLWNVGNAPLTKGKNEIKFGWQKGCAWGGGGWFQENNEKKDKNKKKLNKTKK